MGQTFLGQTFCRLKRGHHWGDAALAALGGYAAAMCVWELTHAPALIGFLWTNDLALAARARLALLLVGGAGVALLIWLILGWLFARRGQPAARRIAARWVFLAAPLPFLPILHAASTASQPIPRSFFWGTMIALAAMTFVAVRALVVAYMGSRLPDAPTASQTPSPGRITAHNKSTGKAGRIGLAVTLVLTAGYALYMSLLTVARHNSFMTHAFDLGIHDQAIYNILHSGYMRATLYGPYAIDYIGDHFSPILFALAPFYALGADARLLLVLQSIALAAGAIPVYLLARHKTGSAVAGSVLAASYLLYPALHGVNLDDFHQIALVSFLLLAALYFLETGRDVAFLVGLGLALLVKEEVALTVIALGGYIFLGQRRYRFGAALIAVGLAYFAVVVGWLMPLLGGTPQIDSRFGGVIAPGTRGAAGVAWTLVTNPVFTAATILGNPDKLTLLLQLFGPVLFLPLLAPAAAWLPALPALAILMLTWTPAQYSIEYHYTAHIIPFVFGLTILGWARVISARSRASFGRVSGILAACLLIATLALSCQYGRLLPKRGDVIPRPDPHAAVIESLMAQVPAGAPVSTLSDIVPHLTTRRTIYLFPDVADAEYLLLDTAPRANFWPHTGLKARSKALRDMLPHIQSGTFGLIRQEDGALLLKRGLTPPRTAEALTALFSARYEAEDQPSDLADAPVADAQASGGKARMAVPADGSSRQRADGKSGLVFGPYADLPPGKFRVDFRLKVDATPRAERVATVDVFTFRDGGVPRAAREIQGIEFGAANQYQLFDLEFESDKPLEDVEFRVQYAGQGTLWLDYVQITPIELWLK